MANSDLRLPLICKFLRAVARVQMGADFHGRPNAIGMRNRSTIDPDERDVRATGSIYMSRLQQDQWQHQGS